MTDGQDAKVAALMAAIGVARQRREKLAALSRRAQELRDQLRDVEIAIEATQAERREDDSVMEALQSLGLPMGSWREEAW